MLLFTVMNAVYEYYAQRAEAALIDPLTMPGVLQEPVSLIGSQVRMPIRSPRESLQRDVADNFCSVVAEVGDFVLRASEVIPFVRESRPDYPSNERVLEKIGGILIPKHEKLKTGHIEDIQVGALIPEETDKSLIDLALGSWSATKKRNCAYQPTWSNPDRQVMLHLEGTLCVGGRKIGQMACLGIVAARPRLDGYAFCATPFPTNELFAKSALQESRAVATVMDQYNVLMAFQGGYETARRQRKRP